MRFFYDTGRQGWTHWLYERVLVQTTTDSINSAVVIWTQFAVVVDWETKKKPKKRHGLSWKTQRTKKQKAVDHGANVSRGIKGEISETWR